MTRPAGLLLLLAALVLPATMPTGVWAAAAERAEIRRLVAAEARQIGVPVALALAVARAESDFDPRAHSHKGARGVMQVMPDTAIGEYGIHPDLLWRPRINVRLGLHFLKRLLRRYRGRVDLALSYYNGGSAVGDLPRARIIPATFRYVRKVQRFRLDYRRRIWRGAMDD
ncbi:MAG: lytic transglycosylase domain-containing protein [Alphaproteobacteria bacterium]|jgi:soluble lytic murein transglycosylase-like protein|nr:lytic transglycosylase domain-containing protein [Alphaproteobacteria bacterium]MDP6815592.1 lytic transglycosylase domain-containing protein [Alphaproteobacteria bacterium]